MVGPLGPGQPCDLYSLIQSRPELLCEARDLRHFLIQLAFGMSYVTHKNIHHLRYHPQHILVNTARNPHDPSCLTLTTLTQVTEELVPKVHGLGPKALYLDASDAVETHCDAVYV